MIKFVPVIVIVSPGLASVGLKDTITEGVENINPLTTATPAGVVTLIVPELPLPITALIVVADTTVKEETGVPPKLTAVAPVKFVPVMVTILPVVEFMGDTLEIEGADVNSNPVRESLPFVPLTAMDPEVPGPTTAVITLSDSMVKESAAVPPKVTAVALVNPSPLIVTGVPKAAVTGVKDKITGAIIALLLTQFEAVPVRPKLVNVPVNVFFV